MEGTLWGAGRLCRRGGRYEGRGLTEAKGAVQSKKLRARRPPATRHAQVDTVFRPPPRPPGRPHKATSALPPHKLVRLRPGQEVYRRDMIPAYRHRSSHGTPRPSAAYPGNQRPEILIAARPREPDRAWCAWVRRRGEPPGRGGWGTRLKARGWRRRNPCSEGHAWSVTRL